MLPHCFSRDISWLPSPVSLWSIVWESVSVVASSPAEMVDGGPWWGGEISFRLRRKEILESNDGSIPVIVSYNDFHWNHRFVMSYTRSWQRSWASIKLIADVRLLDNELPKLDTYFYMILSISCYHHFTGFPSPPAYYCARFWFY